MCGIAGLVELSLDPIPDLQRRLEIMNEIQKHRGPDGHAIWLHNSHGIGLAHRRLSIIDLSMGDQPMSDDTGNWITFNGEIYNYIELRNELGEEKFHTTSDTEVILKAYEKWGADCVSHFRGMFAFALWDEGQQLLFCARDRFGIKPFCYTTVGNIFCFASEAKTLLPFLPSIETDINGFQDYLTFQFFLNGKTLFKNITELMPGHSLIVRRSQITIRRYWQVYYTRDFLHSAAYFEEQIRSILTNSVAVHLRSDVPVGSFVSGGLDSSVIASLARRVSNDEFLGFTGKFSFGNKYDESKYAGLLAKQADFKLYEVDITVDDFVDNIRKVIYHLDYPVAGPGSFPQYMVSALAGKYRKVVLGGQGGDEIFGGYARYLVAYFEQCIKGAIEGTLHDGNFIVTYESIIPNLSVLNEYKPMLQSFWKSGLFDSKDKRYFQLMNRAPLIGDEVNWDALGTYRPFEVFCDIFNSYNVEQGSYFDNMTHFDFKTFLPALLQVEDRVSMAHGLESRVPLLDHALVEFAATIPSSVKFRDGTLKRVFRDAVQDLIPEAILNRKDKMGFPVPLVEWMKGDAHDFVFDVMSTQQARTRPLIDNRKVLENLSKEATFGRTMWGYLSLELWQQEFHDKHATYKAMLEQPGLPAVPPYGGVLS